MVEKPVLRICSYKSYLHYKHTIDRLRESPCTRKQLAESLDIDITNTWAVIRTLVRLGVIKRVSYDNEDGHKKSVYGLIKDE